MKDKTDYFQSLELMQAGVPRESADLFFYDEKKEDKVLEITSVPCWSIGALWQYLYEHNCDMAFTFDTEQSTEELMDGLVKAAKMVRGRE